jgi:adenylate cyclase
VKVVFNGVTVADSPNARVMRESRHVPVYYMPQSEVRMDLMHRTDHRTYCPFKGNASYWTLTVGDHTAENAVWSYEDPFDEVAEIKGYVAFYSSKMDGLYEEDQEVAIDAGSAMVHPNRFVDWLLREAWEAATSEELVARLARRLVEAGFPLSRLRIIIRTLHPQVMGTGYTWRSNTGEVTAEAAPHRILESSAFIDSPLYLVIQGGGGIRRRLDVPDPLLDFPVLNEFRDEGVTDYVAMPLLFSDGQINVITLTSDRAGGFTTNDLGQLWEILPLLSRLFEVQAMRFNARSLLDTYLGQQTGERVLNGLVKRGDGMCIPAVIWLSDLRDSTAMTESLSREAYLAVLNDFFDSTAGAALDHGGEVLKFIGDAVLAIFPVNDERTGSELDGGTDVETACDRALRAARAAVARIDALKANRDRSEVPSLRCALALHLGEVTYGNVGVDTRLDFTVIGPAANAAARLADLSKSLGHQVVASEEFARHASEELVPLGAHTMRGVQGEHQVFSLKE